LTRSKATILVKVRFLEKDPRTLPEMRAKVAFLSRTLKEEEQKSFTALPHLHSSPTGIRPLFLSFTKTVSWRNRSRQVSPSGT